MRRESGLTVLIADDNADVERPTAAGANGYVTKDRILGELVDAIHKAAAAA